MYKRQAAKGAESAAEDAGKVVESGSSSGKRKDGRSTITAASSPSTFPSNALSVSRLYFLAYSLNSFTLLPQ